MFDITKCANSLKLKFEFNRIAFSLFSNSCTLPFPAILLLNCASRHVASFGIWGVRSHTHKPLHTPKTLETCKKKSTSSLTQKASRLRQIARLKQQLFLSFTFHKYFDHNIWNREKRKQCSSFNTFNRC